MIAEHEESKRDFSHTSPADFYAVRICWENPYFLFLRGPSGDQQSEVIVPLIFVEHRPTSTIMWRTPSRDEDDGRM